QMVDLSRISARSQAKEWTRFNGMAARTGPLVFRAWTQWRHPRAIDLLHLDQFVLQRGRSGSNTQNFSKCSRKIPLTGSCSFNRSISLTEEKKSCSESARQEQQILAQGLI